MIENIKMRSASVIGPLGRTADAKIPYQPRYPALSTRTQVRSRDCAVQAVREPASHLPQSLKAGGGDEFRYQSAQSRLRLTAHAEAHSEERSRVLFRCTGQR